MISMIREQEIRAQAFEEGFIEGYMEEFIKGYKEGRREQALILLDRLLATGMPEEQAHALVFGADESIDEDCPEIDPQKTPELWAKMMDALARRNCKMAQRMA